MKATGIVRRMDDLGRVVIPKEIRRTLGLKDGAALEIYTNKADGKVQIIFQKYETVNAADWQKAGAVLSYVTKLPFILCDEDEDIQFISEGAVKDDISERVEIPGGYGFVRSDDPNIKQLADMLAAMFE